jgi:cellulose synthase/poly-beta-1,6-N-acetylglucosamine synthase-like glycosyltransferase
VEADFNVPDCEYIQTHDADSLVLPRYLTTLVSIMESDPRLAVAQTPYSAIPGSRNRLERAAGAQTDIQYIVHQGFTAFNATFWVGANAVLRSAALRDIQTRVLEKENVVPVFIQDRTVIEDTGSTVDLITPRVASSQPSRMSGVQRDASGFRFAHYPKAQMV